MTKVNISGRGFLVANLALTQGINRQVSYTPWCCNRGTWLCWFRKAFMVGSFLVKLQDKWENSQLQSEVAFSCLKQTFVCTEQQPLFTGQCWGDTGHVHSQCSPGLCAYLSPVLEEVFPEDLLCSVLMIKHFCKECGNFFCFGTQLHDFTYKERFSS